MSVGTRPRLVGIAVAVLGLTGTLLASTGTAHADQGPVTPVTGATPTHLSCPPGATASTTCLAVADTHVVAVRADGTKVGSPATVTTTGSTYDLVDISCASATLCVAIGTQHTSGGASPVALPLDPTGTVVGVPVTLPVAVPQAISCGSTTSCGVGGDDGQGHGVTTALAVSGTTVTAGGPVGTIDRLSDLAAISCVHVPNAQCYVGGSGNAGTAGNPLQVGVTAIDTPGQAATGSFLLSLTPSDPTTDVRDVRGIGCGVYVGETRGGEGSYGDITGIHPPLDLQAGPLDAVSVLDDTHCLATGTNGINGIAVPITISRCPSCGLLYTAGTVQTIPGTAELTGVACASTTLCAAVGRDRSDDGLVAAVSPDGSYTGPGAAPACQEAPGQAFTSQIVGIAGFANGYLLTDSSGHVISCGDAPTPAPAPTGLVARIVGIAPAAAGKGYDLVGADGGVFTYDGAAFDGSAGDLQLAAPVVGITADVQTGGYWLTAADGGVFNYGAPFRGSAGNLHLTAPVVGIAADDATEGYWLTAADGGVFNYGAPFAGSAGNLQLAAPVVGIAAGPVGGYRLAAADGGVFNYGTDFGGSAAGLPLGGPVVGIAGDYWLAGQDGGIFNYGSAPFEGSAAGIVFETPTSPAPVVKS